MGFKKLRGVDLPEEQQGLIRYTCLTWRTQPTKTIEKIRHLCQQAGGPYCAALWDVMCTRDSITSIALRHHASEGTLYQLRKRFYESW